MLTGNYLHIFSLIFRLYLFYFTKKVALTVQLAWEKAKYFSKYFLFRLVVKIRLQNCFSLVLIGRLWKYWFAWLEELLLENPVLLDQYCFLWQYINYCVVWRDNTDSGNIRRLWRSRLEKLWFETPFFLWSRGNIFSTVLSGTVYLCIRLDIFEICHKYCNENIRIYYINY